MFFAFCFNLFCFLKILNALYLCVLPPPRRLCLTRRLCVGLSVCLLSTLHKNYWTDLYENYTTRTRKTWLNFGSHPPPGPKTGICWRIFLHCEIGHFSTLWLIFGNTDRNFMKILSTMCLWIRKSPLNFGSHTHHPDTWRRSALSECYSICLFFCWFSKILASDKID